MTTLANDNLATEASRASFVGHGEENAGTCQAHLHMVAVEPNSGEGVLVFRTTVNTASQMRSLSAELTTLVGHDRWSFDLDDRDRVLRIERTASSPHAVIALLHAKGYLSAELE